MKATSNITLTKCKTRADWRVERLKTIGASDAATAIGRGRWKTPEQLWNEMRDAASGHVPPDKSSDDMRRGTIFEPIAREMLAEKLGVSIEPHDPLTIVRNPSMPWAHCTPDAWIGDQVVEIKVPRPGTIAKCNLEGLLEAWVIQGQHTNAIVGSPVCHFGLLDPISATLHYFRLERDASFGIELMMAEAEFFDAVKNGIKPDATSVSDEILDDATLTLDDPASIELARTWFRLRTMKDDADEMLENVKAKLVKASKDAHCFIVEGVGKFRHKPQAGARGLNKENILATFPQINDDPRMWKTNKPSRPFVGRELD